MLEKLISIVAEQLNVEEEEVRPETDFRKDLGADSLDLFELVSALESELESSAGSLSVSSFTRVTVLSPLVQVTDWMLSSLMLGNSARAMSSSTWISRAVGRVLAMVYTVSLPSTLA